MTIPEEERDELRRWADDCIKHNDIDDVPEKVIRLLDALDEAERRIAELEADRNGWRDATRRLEGQLWNANARREKECAALMRVIEETEREEDNGQLGA